MIWKRPSIWETDLLYDFFRFYYVLPQSSRSEQRTASGEVYGNYAFVAPEGDEFRFKYDAGKEGYRVESDALPIPPEDTDEVKKAKEQFFEAFNKALELAEIYDEEEEESEEESEESDESFEESDESYEDSDEDSDESSEESDEDDEDEDEEQEASSFKKPTLIQKKKVDLTKSGRFRRPIYPNYKKVPIQFTNGFGERVNGQNYFRRWLAYVNFIRL